MSDSSHIVGIDIGGTCTDCVVLHRDGGATIAKAFSTPPDFSQGIVDAIATAAGELDLSTRELLDATWLFLHSTTIAENAMVDGDFSTPGLITTSGFGDTLYASRGGYGRWSGLTDSKYASFQWPSTGSASAQRISARTTSTPRDASRR